MTERRSKLWLTVFTLPTFVLLLALGFWQLDRLGEKRALLDRIEAGMAAAPDALPPVIGAPRDFDYHRVSVRGRFAHDQELHLHRRSVEGHGGYQILTPLIRDEGPAVLVNRGWVPPPLKDAAARRQGQVAGEVTVTGIARLGDASGAFTPDDQPAENIWYHVDLHTMTEALGISLAPVLVEADPAPVPGGWPQGGQTRLDIPNNHLEYAVTWFGFAAVLAVIYIVYIRRRS